MRSVRIIGLHLAAAVTLGAWIASAPPASNPDGVYHLVSIRCAEGTNDVDCVEIPDDPDRVLVPRSVQQAACYAYDPLETALCAQQFMTAPIEVLAPTARGNLGGERPELYYRVMHLLQGEDTLTSATRMRIANASLGILLVGATSALARPSVRRGLHAAWLLTAVPLVVWLLSTTNSGAWLIAGLGTAWANALTASDGGAARWRRATAAGVGVLGAVMALGARTEAAVPLLAIAVAVTALRAPGFRPLIVRLRRRDAVLPIAMTSLGAVAVVGTVVVLLPETATVSTPFAAFVEGLERLRERGAGNPLLHLVVTVPSLLMGGLGVGWGLGWVDTLVPVPVGGIVLGSWSAVLARTLRGMGARQASAVVILGVTAVAFPVFTLAYYGLFVGEQFQPRHYVILLLLTMGVAALGGSDRPPLLSAGQRIVLVAGLAIAHAHLLHQNTRRYVTGLRTEVLFDLGRDAEWWWLTYPIGPTANWLIGSAAFTIVAWWLSRILTEDLRAGPPTAPLGGAVAPAMPPTARP